MLILVSFSNFGNQTSQGYVFKDLYATDLLHHMSVFVHLPKGIPPANPYYSGQPWHYYWISHTLPAFIYTISGFSLLPKNIMLLLSMSYAVIFLSLLLFLITRYFEDKKVILLTLLLSLFAYGYNDLFVLFKNIILMLPESIANQLHLGYFISDSHGEQFTGYSHGWFRNFLVEPHSTLAISILFAILIIVKREGILIPERGRCLLRGLLFGMIFSIDAFIGVISIGWYVLATCLTFLQGKVSIKNYIYQMMIIFFPIGMILFFLYEVDIISPGSSHLIFMPNIRMIILSPFYYLIDYGPVGFLGATGIYLLIKHKEMRHYGPHVILAATCLFFMFFVNLSPVGTTQMFRKAGMVFRIPLILFAGASLQYIFKYHSKKNVTLLFISIILALPTPFIDMYRLSNWRTGASFMKQEDFEAQQWIKSNLPTASIIQDFPQDITPIVAFGERRVALGDWEHAKSSGITVEKISERFQKIRYLFETEDPTVALNIARQFAINYIYINPYIREKFINGSQKFDTATGIFQKVYSKRGVAIYKVGGET